MRSHTDYVRPNEVAQLRHELAAYRRFKQLTARWVHVALRRSRWVIVSGGMKVGESRRFEVPFSSGGFSSRSST
mgnify:CR=1 FL=1